MPKPTISAVLQEHRQKQLNDDGNEKKTSKKKEPKNPDINLQIHLIHTAAKIWKSKDVK